ncbi:MAG TPA: hypothetical protein VMR92_09370, partial [Gemmatimonadales bacterium]|nr:hypothetical protein [Gemmatimonadales bacterium]
MAPKRPAAELSRRAFLALTGGVGVLYVLPPPSGLSYAPRAEDLLIPPLPIDPDSGPAWRMLGPFRGGRVDAATGVPGRPN